MTPTEPEAPGKQEAIGHPGRPWIDLTLPLCEVASGAVELTQKGAVKLCPGVPL